MTGKLEMSPALDFRRTVAIVAAANLAYFAVEGAVALNIGSVSLFADSVDFLEDAAVNLLIFAAVGWTLARRARLGSFLALLLLAPAIAFFWTFWTKIVDPRPPAATPLALTGLGALVVNLVCAWLLARFRTHGGSLARAAFLSARNDAFANALIIGAGLVTAAHPSVWPDVLVGLAIALINIDAAKEVHDAAREEHAAAHA